MSSHAIHSFRTARKWCGRRYPCPRRCSEFLPLFLQYPVTCSLPASSGKRKNLHRTQANPVPVNGCRMKTGTCGGGGECDARKVYSLQTVSSCRLLTTTAMNFTPASHTEKRAPASFRQIFGGREPAVELGDQLPRCTDLSPKCGR